MLNVRKLWPLISMRNHGGKLKSICFSLTSSTSGQNLILGGKHRLCKLEAVTKLQGRKYQRDSKGMVIKATLALLFSLKVQSLTNTKGAFNTFKWHMKILPLEVKTVLWIKTSEDFTKQSSSTSIALEYLNNFNQVSNPAMLLQQSWQAFCNDLVVKVEYDRFLFLHVSGVKAYNHK